LEDGGGLLLRVYESQGARGQVTVEPLARWTLDRQLDLLERETGPPDSRLTPFAVRSWRLTT